MDSRDPVRAFSRSGPLRPDPKAGSRAAIRPLTEKKLVSPAPFHGDRLASNPLDLAAGRVVLITGATGGIGLETARALARMGADVVIGARDAARGQAVVDELLRDGGRAELLPIDISWFASVRRAAERCAAAHPSLDVLVNNAGIVSRSRQLSPEGHELTWATNFLGAFLLTRLLLPRLQAARAARVVNVSSEAHKVGRMEWENLELERGYRPFRAYANSKLALVLFTRELARREPAVAVNAVHPGAIATGIWRAAPALARWILQAVLPSAEKGARHIVRLAGSAELEGVSGRYFDKGREVLPAPAARSESDGARLWDVAEKSTTL